MIYYVALPFVRVDGGLAPGAKDYFADIPEADPGARIGDRGCRRLDRVRGLLCRLRQRGHDAVQICPALAVRLSPCLPVGRGPWPMKIQTS
jgi:hypothetical protein